jgi:hypothetical protein
MRSFNDLSTSVYQHVRWEKTAALRFSWTLALSAQLKAVLKTLVSLAFTVCRSRTRENRRKLVYGHSRDSHPLYTIRAWGVAPPTCATYS